MWQVRRIFAKRSNTVELKKGADVPTQLNATELFDVPPANVPMVVPS